ncbi:hypothetical protein AB3Z07_22490 [Metabacillus halosaccharovorans]|uniref:hypothetical protein n=1 Tax=Metabacillus halosaccharovorans TaxID=930124 RepID=UPI001473D35B|nr:hypothetical protein [Metabacillus halosaccharovorans]MCM3439858.1 hypothetical protein [Metabacillus halosaccharovorans]
MWVITVYADDRIKMFEFEDEKEAKESIKKIQGSKILSHVIYFNDQFIEAAS